MKLKTPPLGSGDGVFSQSASWRSQLADRISSANLLAENPEHFCAADHALASQRSSGAPFTLHSHLLGTTHLALLTALNTVTFSHNEDSLINLDQPKF